MTENYSNTISADAFDELDEAQNELSGRLLQIHPVKIDGGLIKLGNKPFVVGRNEDCEMTVSDNSVSRTHAKFQVEDGSFWITDLDSTNGTFVNQKRIKTSRELQSGDRVRIGGRIFKFIATDEVEAQYHEAVYSMMTKDSLTSAWNKQYFMDVLQRDIARRKRSKRSFGLMMMDLDHFKSINDNYSHLVGDEVLIEMALRIFCSIRADDVFARYGGEEFAIILSDAELEAAKQVGERCREVIAETPFDTTLGPIDCTVSIGLTIIDEDNPFSLKELISAADAKLYEAKNAGRNQLRY